MVLGPCLVREEKHAGWGGRIRTSESRNQNPLPYHLATPQAPRHVNRKASLPATRPPTNPRHVGVKIEAYHGREDGIHGGRPVRSGERGARPRVAARRGGNESKAARWRSGCDFPVISRLRAIFPDLAVGNSRLRAPAMRHCGCSK